MQHLRKSPKVISKIPKRCLQNPKKVSPGPGKMRHRFKSGVQPQRHRMDFWCHFSNTSARPKSRKKCLQNLEKVSPKSRKSVSKISKKCLQNLQKVSPKSPKSVSKTSQSEKSIGRCTDARPEGGVHSLMYGCTPWREVHSLMYGCTPW